MEIKKGVEIKTQVRVRLIDKSKIFESISPQELILMINNGVVLADYDSGWIDDNT